MMDKASIELSNVLFEKNNKVFRDDAELEHFRAWLIGNGFYDAPASLRHHGAEEGGLCRHSLAVANILVDLTQHNKLMWTRPESPWVVGFLHDMCKMDDYVCTGMEDGELTWEWNKNAVFTGHGDKSVLMLAPYIQLTPEEVMCIRWHMGAFDDKENWSRYTAAIHEYPNVLWTHHADMMATHEWGI